MPERDPLEDREARDSIRRDLDQNLFVEAGAGSGKTTALVDRVKALVAPVDPETAPVALSSVAAITFTEKAGAELRERLRETLERTAAGEPDTSRGAACRAALDELDGAAIGTLHSFAQRILSEHPVEAGLPPRVEVLDEVTSGVEFERRWARFSDRLFADPRYERTLLLLFAAGMSDSTPHALARNFNDNWDLVDECVPARSPQPSEVGPRVGAVLDTISVVCDHAADCIDPTDLLLARLTEVSDWVERVQAAPDDTALVEALRDWRDGTGPGFRCRGGRRGSWRIPVQEVKDDLAAAGDEIDDLLNSIATECAHHLGCAIRGFTIESAEERRSAGRLEFHDLLVMARSLLRHRTRGARVRTALHDRYQRLLLDEFQDTDPIQIELAVRIAASDPASTDAGTLPWDQVEVAPGRLFIVGDPKQSIYRFRRADIALFLAAAERFGRPPAASTTLTSNFRTGPEVINWVNTTFGRLLADTPNPDLLIASQPDYIELDAVRSNAPSGPPVAVLGRTPHEPKTKAAVVRTAEAGDVVATIQRALAERWQVDDDDHNDEGERWRDARLGDITILVPARTSLPYLEEALTDAGIPYRAEASSLVYATRAVRDLLMVARAVADPTDTLCVVAALRTPLFGCGDDDLYRYRVERRGSWSYLAPRRDPVPDGDPVAAGLAALAEWYRRRAWLTPSGLLDAIARDRRALELAFAEGRPRDAWRRIRFVVDQARAWTDATGGDLRGYLEWVDQQTVEGARVAEAVLPETDDDAVRIMTIHAAKGLEFPITIVSGMSGSPGHSPKPGEARFLDGRVSYFLGKHAETPEFTDSRPVDEQMAFDERVRLLYVATTRAKDHLVVSLHRVARMSPPSSQSNRTNAELLVDGMGTLLDGVDDGPAETTTPGPAPGPTRVAQPEPFDEWQDAHLRAMAASRRPTTVAATALTDEGRPDVEPADGTGGEILGDADRPQGARPTGKARPLAGRPAAEDQLALNFDAPPAPPDLDVAPDGADAGLRKRPGDLDRPPWLKGRYGTAVGRAVHGVLQTIDLSAGPGDVAIDGAVAAQCHAEAVPDRVTTVSRLVTEALSSPSVVEAAASPHWREVYACTPIGDRLLEGYVDLLYRSSDGLVVVDYKTAATRDPAELDRRVDGYRMQGASYAVTVGASTGEAVTRVTFLFLTPDGAVERHLDGLPAAMAEVESAVAAGTVTELA